MRKYIMPTIIPVPKKLNVLLATRVYAFVSSTTVINDTNDEGWYGTKEELKESEDFYPFILIKLGVPTNI